MSSLMRRVPVLLVVSWLLFLALGIWTSGRTPAHHEEISTFPTRPARVLVMNPQTEQLELEPSCADEDPPDTVSSKGRPQLAVCVGGLTLPVLIASYASGIPHWHALLGWPLHDGTVIGLRRWVLLVGLFSLFLVHRVVSRLQDELTAGITTLVMAVSPVFILLHATLLQFEVAPWLLILMAALVVLGPKGNTTPRRPWLTGLLIGLATASNVKAVFLLTIIVAVAWRVKALQRVTRGDVGKAAVGFVIGLIPLWGPAVVFSGDRLNQQVSNRTSFFSRSTTLADVGRELLNVIRFASDTASYSSPDWEPLGVIGILTGALIGLCMIYVVVQAVRVMLSRGGHPVEAISGLLIVAFIVISLKLYNKPQGANYAPLQGIFAITIATAITSFVRWLGDKNVAGFGNPVRASIAIASLFMFGLTHAIYSRLSDIDDVPMPINARAEQRLMTYLMEHPDPDATLYTTYYNLAGVIDSLGRGELSTVRLERVFNSCPNGDMECVDTRFGLLMDYPGALPARIVLPAAVTVRDEGNAGAYEGAMTRAAERAGVTVTLEGDFAVGVDGDGVPAIRLVRLDRS
ncbi:MAG: hypothetical protein AAF799_22195 [Myxococcota bacterium]